MEIRNCEAMMAEIKSLIACLNQNVSDEERKVLIRSNVKMLITNNNSYLNELFKASWEADCKFSTEDLVEAICDFVPEMSLKSLESFSEIMYSNRSFHNLGYACKDNAAFTPLIEAFVGHAKRADITDEEASKTLGIAATIVLDFVKQDGTMVVGLKDWYELCLLKPYLIDELCYWVPFWCEKLLAADIIDLYYLVENLRLIAGGEETKWTRELSIGAKYTSLGNILHGDVPATQKKPVTALLTMMRFSLKK